MQVVDAILFVVCKCPHIFVCLSEAGEQGQQGSAQMRAVCDLVKQYQSVQSDQDSARAVALTEDIRCELENKHVLLAPFERAAKAAFEAELLSAALQVSIPRVQLLHCVPCTAESSQHHWTAVGMLSCCQYQAT